MARVLASVRNLDEALMAAAAPVDIIDLKAPEHGALGALPLHEIQAITRSLGGQRILSATIGDLPLEPDRVVTAVRAIAATGVDYVKIGLFADGDVWGTLTALTPLARGGVRLVAVMFGDQNPDPGLVDLIATAGFAGCMLDTADKQRGSLTQICSSAQLMRFVLEVQRRGLLCGLAGSLTLADIARLEPLRPDYLGFRGALCVEHDRVGRLDPDRLARVAAAVRCWGNSKIPREPHAQTPYLAPHEKTCA